MTEPHYTDTVFYQIELTAKYCKMLGAQVFAKLAGISCEEFAVLDVLLFNPQLCQRDLAKLILKDRANTGKLLEAMERKNLIRRIISVKNNRTVKIIEITRKGEELAADIKERMQPHHDMLKEKLGNSEIAKIGGLLRELRNVLKETIEIAI